jgi:carboxynorspermidine decarboxylase
MQPRFDPRIPRTPCYVVDLELIERNLRELARIQELSGAKILLALKGFAAWSVFPLVSRYLSGFAVSGLHEAKLAKDYGTGEVHAFSPAFDPGDFPAIADLADHVVFNSFAQWTRYREAVASAPQPPSCGIRVNPEHSEVATPLYDPCAPGSRLGVRSAQFREDLLEGIDGLHFHTLCERNSYALARTLEAFESRFARWLPRMKWVNFGGGHHITRPGYDTDLLVSLLRTFRDRWGVQIYLEPGEAIALNAGYLVASVLDIIDNGGEIAILDASATAHMPDVLEMPYRPAIVGSGLAGELAHTYRLAGNTCLPGDVIGDYSFAEPLHPGDRLVFLDMAHYTMVKNTTFNGVRLPDIVLLDAGGLKLQRSFGYEDYRDRLS